jgi:hypothetical protein
MYETALGKDHDRCSDREGRRKRYGEAIDTALIVSSANEDDTLQSIKSVCGRKIHALWTIARPPELGTTIKGVNIMMSHNPEAPHSLLRLDL